VTIIIEHTYIRPKGENIIIVVGLICSALYSNVLKIPGILFVKEKKIKRKGCTLT
jgi:hypothetical protein